MGAETRGCRCSGTCRAHSSLHRSPFGSLASLHRRPLGALSSLHHISCGTLCSIHRIFPCAAPICLPRLHRTSPPTPQHLSLLNPPKLNPLQKRARCHAPFPSACTVQRTRRIFILSTKASCFSWLRSSHLQHLQRLLHASRRACRKLGHHVHLCGEGHRSRGEAPL